MSKERFLSLIFWRIALDSTIFVREAQKKKARLCGLSFIKATGYWSARILLASAISWKIPACFLATIALMTSRVATISAMAMIKQIPYALTVAGVAFVSFILAGLIQNVVINLIIAVALMVATLLVIKAIVAKKHAGIFEEMAEANKALAKQQ